MPEECPSFCPFNYDPVCGDNGETYSNECQFDVAKCNGEVNEIAFEGDCETSIEILPIIGLAAPSYLSIEGYEDCLDIDNSNIGVSMLCLPKEKPMDCSEDSWLKINVEFNGNGCPEVSSYIEALDNFWDDLFSWLEPTSDDDYDYGYDYESCEEVIKEDILSANECEELCFHDWDCADWHFDEDEMQCVLEFVCTTFFFDRNPEDS